MSRQNIAFPLNIAEEWKIRKGYPHGAGNLDLVELGDFGTSSSELSGGMRKRVLSKISYTQPFSSPSCRP